VSDSYLFYEITGQIEGSDYGNERLVEALEVVVRMHKPTPVNVVNQNDCPEHCFKPGRDGRESRPEVYRNCPTCKVTVEDRCASRTCMDCGVYPCETLRKVAEVLGL
jgi:hypothetical protein